MLILPVSSTDTYQDGGSPLVIDDTEDDLSPTISTSPRDSVTDNSILTNIHRLWTKVDDRRGHVPDTAMLERVIANYAHMTSTKFFVLKQTGQFGFLSMYLSLTRLRYFNINV